MSKHAPLIDDEGEVRELTVDDIKRMHSAAEVLPPELLKVLGIKPRGKQKAPLKVPTTIRFDADVLAALKASGKGWQTRVNDIMKEWVRTHTPA